MVGSASCLQLYVDLRLFQKLVRSRPGRSSITSSPTELKNLAPGVIMLALNLCRFCSSMSFKRARVASHAAAADRREDPSVAKAKKEGGQELRRFLLEKFCEEGMTGAEVASICWHVTRAGGQGVADLGLQPGTAAKHGHGHVMRHAGQIYPEVDLHYVDCPMHLKREARRCLEKVPIFLPSTAFAKFVTDDMYDHPQSDFDRHIAEVDSYSEHPVVLASKADGFAGKVRPIAIYWDGVAYTKNDSFTGFYVTDILTSQKFLSFLVRAILRSKFDMRSHGREAARRCANVDAGGGALSSPSCGRGQTT